MKLKKQFRVMASDVAMKAGEDRTFEFPFSSEFPVERYFGTEILIHEKSAVDLTYHNGSMPLLFNHDPDKLIGVVEDIKVKDKRLYAKVRMSQSELGEEKLKQVEEGVLRNVSFGYVIHEMEEKVKGKDKVSEFHVTKFSPFEISFVSTPADPSVGLGRSDDALEFEVQVNKEQTTTEEKKEETKKMEQNVEQVRSDARKEVAAIFAMGEKFNDKDLARQLVEKGASLEEARAIFFEKMPAQKPLTGKESDIGLTEREIKQFSFVRAINALSNPQDKNLREQAKFELEVSKAAEQSLGRAARGFVVPTDILRTKLNMSRDLTAGTNSAGGYAVATDLQSGSFIELLRNKAKVIAMGARVLSGLKSNVSIPKQSGGATAYWVAENGAVTESQQTLAQVALTPKTVGAMTDISRRLLLTSSIDVEQMVREDFAAVLGIELDRVALYGSGSSNQPSGLNIASGLNTVNFSADAPTFAEMVAMETAIASDNADVANMKYLVNAAGRGVLKTTEVASNTGIFIAQGGMINGYGFETSNQVASASAAHDYWFGNWADLLIGMFGGLDILVDPYTGSAAGTVRLVAHMDCDIAVRRAESFCKGANNP